VTQAPSIVAEAKRLTALGVPAVRRYGKGVTKESTCWVTRRVSYMVHNPAYNGHMVLNSRHGRITREVEPLVTRELWERAARQVESNRTVGTRKEGSHIYILRGLVICERCGRRFVGYPMQDRRRRPIPYYRCSSYGSAFTRKLTEPCGAKSLNAARLEEQVWQDCRSFILDPGQALAEAQAQLGERRAETERVRADISVIRRQLAAKEGERERVMTLYRRDAISLEEAEGQLAQLAREADQLRAMIEAAQSEEQLTAAWQDHLTSAAAMLGALRDRLEEVERTNDRDVMQRVVEQLVTRIAVESEGEGRKKTACLKISYAFSAPGQYAKYGMERRPSPPTAPTRNR
jgi:site-specific DNA recombinase